MVRPRRSAATIGFPWRTLETFEDNLPRLNSNLRKFPASPSSFCVSQKWETFAAQQTGKLVGVWIAVACTTCGSDLNSFIKVQVSPSTSDFMLDAPLHLGRR